MQRKVKRRVIMAGVIIAGATVGTLIAKLLEPELVYLMYKLGCEDAEEDEL